jgi:hypothetical protein
MLSLTYVCSFGKLRVVVVVVVMVMMTSVVLGKVSENVKFSTTAILGYYELNQYKACFEYECSSLADKRKQAKLQ